MRIKYVEKSFNDEKMELIIKAEGVCKEYAAQGYGLTLRQLYYQFVARGWIPNKDTEYKRLGELINTARLAGLIDWLHIEDRTRNLRTFSKWETPADIIESAVHSYAIDLWANQPTRVEAWVEKDALVGVLETACSKEQVPYFSCRGYTSQSEVWGAGQRLLRHMAGGQNVLVLHLGDHDPSGVDMSRDIAERLQMFCRGKLEDDHDGTWRIHPKDSRKYVEVRRIALTMPQVREHDPPPNPAKVTDSRCAAYMDRYGNESWELDALPPTTLAGLVRQHIQDERLGSTWAEDKRRQEQQRATLRMASERWEEVARFLGKPPEPPAGGLEDDEDLGDNPCDDEDEE